MAAPRLTELTSGGVTLLGDASRPGGVTFAFTERTGGVSGPPYASLNLGGSCGDDPAAVAENRRRVLAAVGAGPAAGRLVMPNQVHGDATCVIRGGGAAELGRVREEAAAGCDAVVCTAPDVPVMLCFADCVPVVLVAPGAFAVVHSGWRGTLAGIAGRALGVLCDEAGCGADQVVAYLGPHISGDDYEVSPALLGRFEGEFGRIVRRGASNLDLASAITRTLVTHGVRPCHVLDSKISTASNLARFYSYRAEGGACGRHGAVAFLPSPRSSSSPRSPSR